MKQWYPDGWSKRRYRLMYGLICSAVLLLFASVSTAAYISTSWFTSTTPSSVHLAPLDGAGGPILVVTPAYDSFARYYGEILRAEGFNDFRVLDIEQIKDTVLSEYDVVILGEMTLTVPQITMLADWVKAGGNLIAMRPDTKLAPLLGLTPSSAVRSDAYLLIDTTSGPGTGIVDESIQYHGAATIYGLAGAAALATIYSDPATSTPYPAVTLLSVGVNGGQAASFAFDLARSIVYSRQGNPAWAGHERDGFAPIRPNDLFFPDWVDLNKAAIPQADELQRLLANMIIQMNIDKKPLPRFWYLPAMKKAVILMTGDDHGTTAGTKSTFDHLLAQSPAACSVTDWECYRATSWLYTTSPLTGAQALAYHQLGFEIGVHVDTGCADWVPPILDDLVTNVLVQRVVGYLPAVFYNNLSTAFDHDLSTFAAKYPDLPLQKTSRTHCVPWSDWASQPKVELQNGIRLDMNYYYWPSSWVKNRPGFFSGSGIPMRFADQDGALIDVYQAPTHLVNENGMTYPAGIESMLDKALGAEGYYGVFGTHYDHSDNFDVQLVRSAKARGVSLISAQQLLTWLDGRSASTFGVLSWNGTTLSFAMKVAPGAHRLYAMLPSQVGNRALSTLTINDMPAVFTRQTIKGISYGVFEAATGNIMAKYQ